MRINARTKFVFVFAALLFTFPSFAARREGNLTNAAASELRRDVAVGERLRLEHVPLLGRREALELERFEVFAPDARIVVRRGSREEEMPRPATRYYRGSVPGISDSLAVISVGSEITGMVIVNDRIFTIGKGERASRFAVDESELAVTEIDAEEDAPEGAAGWICDLVDGGGDHPLTQKRLLSPITPQTTTNGSPTYGLRLAIEADYEMRVIKGSVAATVTYVGDLVAAASAIYSRDFQTSLVVGDLYTYDTNSDPWTQVNTSAALNELLGWYNANRRGVHRSAALLVSGKAMSGGIAYVGAACQGSYSTGNAWHYGVIGAMTGVVNTTTPSLYWDVLGFSHELGHLVNSDHTHCIPSTGFGRAWVDLCYGGESGCYSGATSVPVEKGTIMSYCHTKAGGYSNLRLIFGQAGEASQVVSPIIKTYVDATTPSGTLTAPSTVNAASTGNVASVPNQGGLTYFWSISNGVITAGAGTSQITFTAGTGASMTVNVTVRNAAGCTVNNSRTITINTPVTCNATITTPATAAAGSAGNTASVPSQAGATYSWQITNGVITAGQGSRQITFTAGGSVAPLVLTATVTNTGCSDVKVANVTLTGKPTFLDVPVSNVFYSSVEKVFDNGITAGCGGPNYCPSAAVTRAQMAVFLLRSKNGSAYTPPSTYLGYFTDVPNGSFAQTWIEQLYRDNVTGGCGGGKYCPNAAINRAEMAVFLLRAKEGSAYTPPPATGTLFNDVGAGAFAAAWIEELSERGITAGCGGGNYCPTGSVTRGQMAAFLVATFNLP